VLDALLGTGAEVAGILDPGLEVGTAVFGVPVVGGDDWLARAEPAEMLLALGIGVTRGRSRRRELFETYRQKGFTFVAVLHSSAIVGRDTALAEGCQIMAGAVLQCRVDIGANAVINTRSSVDHGCRIGAHVFVSPGVTICGDVDVGEQAFIGSGAVVFPGVRVGRATVVGAGSVVRHSVPAGSVVAGNPAVNIGMSSA
jgi:UDP-perosamine 4-acetyltransferase